MPAMKTMIVGIGILALAAVILSNAKQSIKPGPEEKPVPIPPSVQRTGDAEKGYDYLVTGDYVKGGVPYSFFKMAMGKDRKNYLQREGLNAYVGYDYTVVRARNGENLVAPNCMQCHAQVFNDSVYIGMGNTFIDFSSGQKLDPKQLQTLERILRSTAPKKYDAARPFITVAKTIGPKLTTEVRGVNAADRLAAVLAAHRDPVTFEWMDEAQLQLPDDVIPTDVPAWWLLKKKNAMFYNGFGRGDFGKFLMASNLLTVNDTAESREVDNRINDVLAYIYSIKPPKYPDSINTNLANEGKGLFIDYCSQCHGTYGDGGEYPNLLIPASVIKTDSMLYSSNYQNPQFVTWFNSSWFAKGDHPAKLQPYNGYIAPPLDGVWATGPYLHNASVPTIEGVLNSKQRPKYWSRNFSEPKYDYEKLGWDYKTETAATNTETYNTTLKGYSNRGHTFGDVLTERERKAVIEYLKTL